MKKPFHKFIIPPEDPVFKYDYNYLFFKDRDAKKTFYNEYKMCKAYIKRRNKKLCFSDKQMRTLKKQYMRNVKEVPNYIKNPETTKKHTRKSKHSLIFILSIALVFDLDNTLIKTAYKKHMLSDYDSHFYISILGTKRIRVIHFYPLIHTLL